MHKNNKKRPKNAATNVEKWMVIACKWTIFETKDKYKKKTSMFLRYFRYGLLSEMNWNHLFRGERARIRRKHEREKHYVKGTVANWVSAVFWHSHWFIEGAENIGYHNRYESQSMKIIDMHFINVLYNAQRYTVLRTKYWHILNLVIQCNQRGSSTEWDIKTPVENKGSKTEKK